MYCYRVIASLFRISAACTVLLSLLVALVTPHAVWAEKTEIAPVQNLNIEQVQSYAAQKAALEAKINEFTKIPSKITSHELALLEKMVQALKAAFDKEFSPGDKYNEVIILQDNVESLQEKMKKYQQEQLKKGMPETSPIEKQAKLRQEIQELRQRLGNPEAFREFSEEALKKFEGDRKKLEEHNKKIKAERIKAEEELHRKLGELVEVDKAAVGVEKANKLKAERLTRLKQLQNQHAQLLKVVDALEPADYGGINKVKARLEGIRMEWNQLAAKIKAEVKGGLYSGTGFDASPNDFLRLAQQIAEKDSFRAYLEKGMKNAQDWLKKLRNRSKPELPKGRAAVRDVSLKGIQEGLTDVKSGMDADVQKYGKVQQKSVLRLKELVRDLRDYSQFMDDTELKTWEKANAQSKQVLEYAQANKTFQQGVDAIKKLQSEGNYVAARERIGALSHAANGDELSDLAKLEEGVKALEKPVKTSSRTVRPSPVSETLVPTEERGSLPAEKPSRASRATTPEAQRVADRVAKFRQQNLRDQLARKPIVVEPATSPVEPVASPQKADPVVMKKRNFPLREGRANEPTVVEGSPAPTCKGNACQVEERVPRLPRQGTRIVRIDGVPQIQSPGGKLTGEILSEATVRSWKAKGVPEDVIDTQSAKGQQPGTQKTASNKGTSLQEILKKVDDIKDTAQKLKEIDRLNKVAEQKITEGKHVPEYTKLQEKLRIKAAEALKAKADANPLTAEKLDLEFRQSGTEVLQKKLGQVTKELAGLDKTSPNAKARATELLTTREALFKDLKGAVAQGGELQLKGAIENAQDILGKEGVKLLLQKLQGEVDFGLALKQEARNYAVRDEFVKGPEGVTKITKINTGRFAASAGVAALFIIGTELAMDIAVNAEEQGLGGATGHALQNIFFTPQGWVTLVGGTAVGTAVNSGIEILGAALVTKFGNGAAVLLGVSAPLMLAGGFIYGGHSKVEGIDLQNKTKEQQIAIDNMLIFLGFNPKGRVVIPPVHPLVGSIGVAASAQSAVATWYRAMPCDAVYDNKIQYKLADATTWDAAPAKLRAPSIWQRDNPSFACSLEAVLDSLVTEKKYVFRIVATRVDGKNMESGEGSFTTTRTPNLYVLAEQFAAAHAITDIPFGSASFLTAFRDELLQRTMEMEEKVAYRPSDSRWTTVSKFFYRPEEYISKLPVSDFVYNDETKQPTLPKALRTMNTSTLVKTMEKAWQSERAKLRKEVVALQTKGPQDLARKNPELAETQGEVLFCSLQKPDAQQHIRDAFAPGGAFVAYAPLFSTDEFYNLLLKKSMILINEGKEKLVNCDKKEEIVAKPQEENKDIPPLVQEVPAQQHPQGSQDAYCADLRKEWNAIVQGELGQATDRESYDATQRFFNEAWQEAGCAAT